MKICLLVVGRVRGSVAPAVEEYEKRARRYWKLDVIEVPGGTSGGAKDAADRAREAEADRILSKLPPDLQVVALTRTGTRMGSPELAEYLEEQAVRSSAGVTFVIGGAYGLDSTVLEHASRKVSLSNMTLPHEMARLVLAEQLYRAGTILRGEPYHKG